MESSSKESSIDFDAALLHAGYGRFHGMLLAICGAIYTACAISSTTLSFVLPAAECDFRMDSIDKGRLTSMPLIGMVIGSYVWGSIADSKGRKCIVISSLIVDGLSSVLSSLCTNFYIFLLWRFLSGFGIIGANSLIFSYMGEFFTVQHRDVMLSRLEVFWTLGLVILPGIAWMIIPRTWAIGMVGDATYGLNSWRTFVALCGMPSLLVALIFCVFPESPKFLLAKGREEEAREVLRRICFINTGRRSEEFYPVPIQNVTKEIITNVYKTQPWYKKVLKQLNIILVHNRAIFKQPYLRFIIFCCFADFGLIASYYTLTLWLPDLFDRFDQYQMSHPNESFGVCDVTETGKQDNSTDYDFAQCSYTIDNKVFLYTFIVGVSCIPTSVSLAFLIQKLGKKFLLVFSLLVSGFAALGLNWARSTIGNLVISCVFEAFTNTTETVLFCLVVDLFPTHLRALALSMTVTIGRFGAILGNIAFGILIDMDCVVPIYTFGCLLIVSGLFCLTLPRNRNYTVF